jgi:hypothetical protein
MHTRSILHTFECWRKIKTCQQAMQYQLTFNSMTDLLLDQCPWLEGVDESRVMVSRAICEAYRMGEEL